MKKKILVLVFFLMIILFGCSAEASMPIELTTSNFNSHFVLNYEFKKSSNLCTIKIEPRFEADITDFDATMQFKFSYEKFVKGLKETVYQNRTLSFKSNDNGEIVSTFSITNDSIVNFQLVNYYIEDIEGNIIIYNNPLYSNKGFVTNKSQNRKTYKSLISELSRHNGILTSNHITIDTAVSARIIYNNSYGDFFNEKNTVKFILNSNYTEIGNDFEKTVIKKENGTFYNYSIQANEKGVGIVTKTKVEEKVDIPSDFSIDDVFEYSEVKGTFKFNYRKIKVEKKDSNYEISGFLKDLIGKKAFNQFIKEMEKYDVPKELFKNTIFKYIISIYSGEIIFDVTLDIFLPQGYNANALTIKEELKINFEQFTEIDFTNPYKYYFPVSKSVENATKIAGIGKDVITYENPNPHYYSVEFEESQYVFENLDSRLIIYVYDSNLSSMGGSLSKDGNGKNKFTISIQKGGNYYIKVQTKSNESLSEYRFKIIKVK